MKIFKQTAWCVALCLTASAAQAADADYQYQVKTGDTLGKLSAGLLDSPARWAEVAQYNQLRNPNLIYPQQMLHIPLAWMKNLAAQAHVTAVTGDAKLNGHALHVGDAVASGDQLETAHAAAVRMELPDGSTLNMLEQTKLHANTLQHKERGDYFNAVFRLVTGRIDALKKKYPDGQSPLHIEGLHGTIGVRGTHFRMGQDGENTLAEIEQGLVGFEAGKTNLALAGGQGSVADGVHEPKTIELLPAPIFPTLPESFAPDTVSFVMPVTSGVAGYRGEVAQDEAFTHFIAHVATNSAVVNVPDLGEGVYWIRLRAVDAHGLQGMPAQTAIAVKMAAVPAELPVVAPSKPILNGAQMLTGWHENKAYEYEVQLANAMDFAHLLGSSRTHDNYWNQPIPPAGKYYLRLRLYDAANHVGAWCEPVEFTVP